MKFEQIYETHKNMVYNLALQYVQNTEDAMDITQEVFVALHQSLTTFKGEAQLSTWVYRIAINKSLDFIKAKNRKKRFAWLTSLFNPDTNALQFDIHTFEHPGVILEQKEALAKIFRFINELSDNQKTALILSKIEQKSQVEIAEIMNLSTKAVESLVQRAKQNLEKKLNQQEGY